MTDIRVRVLGPVRLEVDGRTVRLGGQLRLVLAVLATARGRSVSRSRMVELLWPDPAPEAAAATMRSHVAHLRRLLEPARPAGDKPTVLVTDEHGYALRVRPAVDGTPAGGTVLLDAMEFERLLAQAAGARRRGDHAAAADQLATALALWDGDALGDVAGRSFAVAEAARLNALRGTALRLRVEADLAAGRHEQVLGELAELAGAQPLDERLHAQYALALYRCRRPEEAALACSEGVARRRASGLDSLELRALHTAVLRRAPELAWHCAPRPGQLPPDIAEFTGRAAELAELGERLLARSPAGVAAGVVVTAAVDGKPGIGKSALVVHLAHRLAGNFPDGVLYADLRGAQPGRVDPADVLARFLPALGVAEVPAGPDAAVAAYRTATSERRVLVVLDNAADAAQVRPLGPAGGGCAALVTSRRQLGELDGVSTLTLDLLPTEEAVRLLARVAGERRVDADPGSARAVVRYCGLLPLAVRIAAARLRARPAWSLAAFAGRLADERRRLAELAVGDLAVQSSFQLSYRELPEPDARLFRLLGLLDGADFAVGVAAALLDAAAAEVEPALERLVDAQLLETASAGRYRFHDLLRLFARQLAPDDETEGETHDETGALARALRWYVATAWRAVEWLKPAAQRGAGVADGPFGHEHAALEWLDAERANLVAAARQAAEAAPAPVCSVAWELNNALLSYFNHRKAWSEWAAVGTAAIAAADRAGRTGEHAIARRHLGIICTQQRRFAEALMHLEHCLAIFRESGDRVAAAKTTADLGILHAELGQHADAVRCFTAALQVGREIGNRDMESTVLNNLGRVHSVLGDYDTALELVTEALRIQRDVGHANTAGTLESLGAIYRRLGRYREAIARYQDCVAVAREYGDRWNEAYGLRGLGLASRELGDGGSARRYWRPALAIFTSLNAPEADDLRRLLGDPRHRGAQPG